MNTADMLRARFAEVNSEALSYSNGKVYAEPSKIRIETQLKPGQGRYEFNIKKQDIDNPWEKSLDRNDVFVPNYIGVLLALRSNTTPMTEILRSFPVINDGVNPSAYAAGFTADDAEALYNGSLQWTIDNGVLFNAYPTEDFKKIPQTQKAFILDSQDAAKVESVETEWNIKDALELVIPKLVLCGTRDHRITVNFSASGLSFATTAGYTPYLVFYMAGNLIKGGCEFYEGRNPNANAVGTFGCDR